MVWLMSRLSMHDVCLSDNDSISLHSDTYPYMRVGSQHVRKLYFCLINQVSTYCTIFALRNCNQKRLTFWVPDYVISLHVTDTPPQPEYSWAGPGVTHTLDVSVFTEGRTWVSIHIWWENNNVFSSHDVFPSSVSPVNQCIASGQVTQMRWPSNSWLCLLLPLWLCSAPVLWMSACPCLPCIKDFEKAWLLFSPSCSFHIH